MRRWAGPTGRAHRVGDEADHDKGRELPVEGSHVGTPEVGALLEAAREGGNDAHEEDSRNHEPEPLDRGHDRHGRKVQRHDRQDCRVRG